MTTSRERYYLVALLFLTYVFAYTDRSVVSVLVPAIQGTLGLTLVQVSLIQGMAFSLLFAIAGIPIGRAVDRYNRLKILSIGLTVWSLATVACGLSSTFTHLLLSRMAVAVGEACLVPAAASLVSDVFAPLQRGRAMSTVQTGSAVGGIFAFAGGGYLLTWLDTTGILKAHAIPLESWQAVFMLLGAPGLILTAVLLLTVKEPPRAERRAVASDGAGGLIRLVGRYPVTFIGFVVMQTMVTMDSYAVTAWASTVLMTGYDLTAAQAGILVAIMATGAVVAYILAGVISDMAARWRPRYGRMIVPAIIMAPTMAASVWMYFTDNLAATVFTLAVASFGGGMGYATAITTLTAIVPGQLRGQAVAVFFLFTAVLGAGSAPTVVAVAADAAGSLQKAVAAVCAGSMFIALCIWTFVARAYAKTPNYEVDPEPAA